VGKGVEGGRGEAESGSGIWRDWWGCVLGLSFGLRCWREVRGKGEGFVWAEVGPDAEVCLDGG